MNFPPVPRRQFLRDSLQFAGKTALAGAFLIPGWKALAVSDAWSSPAEDPLLELARQLQGAVLLPDDERYPGARLVYCRRTEEVRPLAIAMCETESDVRRALEWAKSRRVPFRVRSGGHSFEGYSVTTGLLIDVSCLDTISIDREAATLTVGAGAKLGAIHEAATAHGFHFVGGTCSTVGIAGYTLGGGMGTLSRPFGLAIDQLLSLRMVTADGRAVRASGHENPDLFWACRGGGGGNFGIVTEFQFQLHPIAGPITLYESNWHGERAQEAYMAWQKWGAMLPREMTSIFYISASPGHIDYASMRGQFLGPKSGLERLMQPLFSDSPPNASRIWEATAKEVIRYFGDDGHFIPQLFKAKSAMLERRWSESDVATLLEKCTRPDQPGTADLHFSLLGGAVSEVEECATAFPHRKGVWASLEVSTMWGDTADTPKFLGWMNQLGGEIARLGSHRAYGNYIDADLPGWENAYYGANLSRLREARAKWDPEGTFDFPQSIRNTRQLSSGSPEPATLMPAF
jgi:hypothetical protein